MAASVPLTRENSVEKLQIAVKEMYADGFLAEVHASDLKIYDDSHAAKPLTQNCQIGQRGKHYSLRSL
ncbi:hypothetical protein PI125_g10813 [Phytophthora idaei]|nr:hypothetical protein PI125_g10813 [Phytophthora idaei]KAG3131981.1 hypothetical protein PI126_g19836 [Phytophthora idaei]